MTITKLASGHFRMLLAGATLVETWLLVPYAVMGGQGALILVLSTTLVVAVAM